MSQISRPVQTVRRHKRLIGLVAAAGLLAGAAYAVLEPPLLTGTGRSCCRSLGKQHKPQRLALVPHSISIHPLKR